MDSTNEEVRFRAPWGTLLKVITALPVAILVGLLLYAGTSGADARLFGAIGLLLAIPVLAAFFAIRGYALCGDTLFVRRIGWSAKVSLTGIASAEADPKAMAWSLRLFGNGGLFCFAGLYWNRRLGSYRAYATDPKRSVVLRFPHRTVVVTPDDPARFVGAMGCLRGQRLTTS